MNYIVLDLEWNQGNPTREPEVYGIPFEIVEIGAIKLNDKKEMIGEFNQLIKPQVYHEMHHITRKLIHLQMEQLEQGKPFVKVFRDFMNWCGEDFLFCTWGPLDLTELQKNMKYYDLDALSDRPLKFYDVQKLFSIAYEDRKSRRSLEYAVDFLNIEKDIPFHRAFSDAYYTAKVLAKITDENVLCNYSFDTFIKPKSRKEEIHITFDTYAKYISREFPDKLHAMEDKDVTGCRCYICHKNIKRKIKWFSPNGKHYYAISYCDKHGYMKGKIRIRKTEEDTVYVVKTEKFITSEEVEELKSKMSKAKEQKKQRKKKSSMMKLKKIPLVKGITQKEGDN